jgi:hypothetical protein
MGVGELITKLRTPKQGTETQQLELGETQANAWASEAIAKQPKLGVKSLEVDFRGPDQIFTKLVVNMDEVELGGYTSVIVGSTLSGLQTLEILGTVAVQEGMGVYTVQNAELNGVTVPSWMASALLSYLSQNQPPNVDVTEPFRLPYGITDVQMTEKTIVIVR